MNLLIGPNGSGKSNLIEAIGLLRSAPRKLTQPMRGRGSSSVQEWIYKKSDQKTATLSALVELPGHPERIQHQISFTEKSSRFELLDEVIENEKPFPTELVPLFYYKYQQGPVLSVRGEGMGGKRGLRREDVLPDESILSQRKDPDQYPELTNLVIAYDQIRLYREWSFGRGSLFRSPQPSDLPNDQLEEDFSNLGLFLNHLRSKPKIKKEILERLQDLYQGLDDFDVRVRGGTVELFLTEEDITIPATRLSDGTLRYLSLLAILSDPSPPPLICIEEPELGLHPDILPKIADLLISASENTQLIVTTHSDILVDAICPQNSRMPLRTGPALPGWKSGGNRGI